MTALFPSQGAGKGLSLQIGLPHPMGWPEIQTRACGGSRSLGSGALQGHEAEPWWTLACLVALRD